MIVSQYINSIKLNKLKNFIAKIKARISILLRFSNTTKTIGSII